MEELKSEILGGFEKKFGGVATLGKHDKGYDIIDGVMRQLLDEQKKYISQSITRITEVAGREAVERVAEYIYEQMPFTEKGIKPKWVVGGNSIKQDEARQKAKSLLEL